MKKNLYINDINLGDFGIYINSDTYLDAPLMDYNEYNIPARNGSVIVSNKRLNNVIRKFECHIPYPDKVVSGLESLKMLLYKNIGYMKIESDYDPDTFQYGYLAESIEVSPFNLGMNATFNLFFSCMPQRYLKEDYVFTEVYGSPYLDTDFYLAYDGKFMQDALSYIKNVYIPSNSVYVGIWDEYEIGSNGVQVKLETDTDISFGAVYLVHFDGDMPVIDEFLGFSPIGNTEYSQTIDIPAYSSIMVLYSYENKDVTGRLITKQSGSERTENIRFSNDLVKIPNNIVSTSFVNNILLKVIIGRGSGSTPISNEALKFIFDNAFVRFELEQMKEDGVVDYLTDNCNETVYVDLMNKSAYAYRGDEVFDISNYLKFVGDVTFNEDFSYIVYSDNPWKTPTRDVYVGQQGYIVKRWKL